MDRQEELLWKQDAMIDQLCDTKSDATSRMKKWQKRYEDLKVVARCELSELVAGACVSSFC